MPEISQLKIAGVLYDIKDTVARNKTLQSSDAAYKDFTYQSPQYNAVTTVLTYSTFIPPVAVQDNNGKVYLVQKDTLVRTNSATWELTLASYLVYAGQTVPNGTWRSWFLVGSFQSSGGGITEQRVLQLIAAHNQAQNTHEDIRDLIPTDVSQLSAAQGLLGGGVQSDWAQSDSSQKSYIKNKPQMGPNYNDFTSSDLVNNILTVQKAIVPVSIVSNTGIYMPIASNSITYSNGTWSINMAPYLAAIDAASVTGTWRVWFSGGISYVGTVSLAQCQSIAVAAAKKQALIFG